MQDDTFEDCVQKVLIGFPDDQDDELKALLRDAIYLGANIIISMGTFARQEQRLELLTQAIHDVYAFTEKRLQEHATNH